MLTHVDNRITYSGNGNATEFAYQFKILDRTDIKVLLTDADGKEKLLTKDYYVDVEKNVVRYPGYAVGAEVPESERPPVLPNGWKLTIYREVPVTQETDLPDQYPFNQVEDISDKLTMIAQQLTDVTGRSLKISVSKSAYIDTTIPWENGKSFRISDDGKTLELTEDPAKVIDGAKRLLAETTTKAEETAANTETTKTNTEKAKQYAEAASDSKDLAKRWAEATDSPDYTTSKSAKTWAEEAKDARDDAKDTAVNLGNPVVSITEDKGTVTVSKSDGSSSSFTTFPKFITIPANADLNDYKQEGFYISPINRDVATLKNCPTPMGFLMEVYTASYLYEDAVDSWVHQRIVTFNSAQVYMRAYGSWDGGKWYPWESIPAIGSILPFAGANSIPTGYLVCDGSAISRTTYAQLYAVIGNTYGAGNGSSTFNLPNLKGRYIEGQNATAVGKVWEAGLPNITGEAKNYTDAGLIRDYSTNESVVTGCFLGGEWTEWYITGDNNKSKIGRALKYDASRSSPIYGNSFTVQPPAVTMRYIIKY